MDYIYGHCPDIALVQWYSIGDLLPINVFTFFVGAINIFTGWTCIYFDISCYLLHVSQLAHGVNKKIFVPRHLNY